MITIAEDKEFLLLQRQKSRLVSMMCVDDQLAQMEKRQSGRAEKEEQRRNKDHQRSNQVT